MRSFVVALCFSGAAAHWSSPEHMAEKFKPMIIACENLDLLANCSSVSTGTCHTGHDGSRFCKTCGGKHGGHHHGDHHHGHHGFWHQMHHMKAIMGLHHDDKHQGHWRQVGDCDANKKDGDVCKVERPGQCIPAGKCPMFHGEMVCRPNDAHPPKFVTEPCNGKEEGDHCEHFLIPGTCTKPKYMSDMYCKVAWPTKEDVTGAMQGFVNMLDSTIPLKSKDEVVAFDSSIPLKPKDEVVIV